MGTRDRRRRAAHTLAVAAVAVVLGAAVAGGRSGDRGPDGAAGPATSAEASTTSSEVWTTETAPTSDGPGATLGADCTVGTIPPGRPVPPGCDRLYSPDLGPGQDCVEGRAPDCIDPDGDGHTWVADGGQCLVRREDPALCRDDDDDGLLDRPSTAEREAEPVGVTMD